MHNVDVSKLTLVGAGSHGKIYRLNNKRCIKVCYKECDMQMEYRVLKHAQGFPQFPQVFACKGNYMIREFIDGQNIVDYIKANGFDTDLAKRLTELIDVFAKLGFTRLDCRLSQIFVTGNKQLKVIDTTRHMDKNADYPYKLLKGLEKLKCKKAFLQYLKEYRPDYYQAWKKRK